MTQNKFFQYIVRNLLKIIFIVLVSFQIFKIFYPFILVLVVAALVAMAVEPYLQRTQNKFKLTRVKTTLALMSFFVLAVLLPTLLFCLKGSNLIVNNLIPYLTHGDSGGSLLAPLQENIVKWGSYFNLDTAFINEKMGMALASFVSFIAELFKSIIAGVPGIIFSVVLFILTLGVFMSNFAACNNFIHKHSSMNEERYNKMILLIAQSSRLIFVSNILTGFIQASIVAIGALFCGFSEIFLIFFVTLICSFVPLVGAAPIALILGIYSFMNGSFAAGVAMLVVTAVASVSDNIVRSITMTSGDSSLHPFVAFLSVIGGVFAYGIPGLLLGPLVASICYDCLPLLIEDLVEDGKNES